MSWATAWPALSSLGPSSSLQCLGQETVLFHHLYQDNGLSGRAWAVLERTSGQGDKFCVLCCLTSGSLFLASSLSACGWVKIESFSHGGLLPKSPLGSCTIHATEGWRVRSDSRR